jgi:hypothetical protein
MDVVERRPHSGVGRLATYPLVQALIDRRSRRFGKSMRLNGGPLAYASTDSPQPLSLDEEAALAFAACGITGYALAELPYQTGDIPEAGGGNIMTHFIGRTVPSGDAMHAVTVFVTNDHGAWMLKRPQDHPRADIAELIEDAREHRFTNLYETNRVAIADRRLDIPRELPFTATFNKWSANVPGTTYYVPVNELSALYINIVLSAFDTEYAYFIVDERNRLQPAGIDRFARSRGGHLVDDLAAGRTTTVASVEAWLYEFAAIEQGAMLQNLGLMSQALGLGGFPHFAAHPFGWLQALGFRMEEVPFSRIIGAEPVTENSISAPGTDIPVPTAVGLERDGAVLIKPYSPPYYRTMEEAVLAFVDYKYAKGRGTLRDGGEATAWKDPVEVQAGIPAYSEQSIAATIAHCDYLYQRYGRFPPGSGPFRTVLAFQAHRLDSDFYERFYRPGSLVDLNDGKDGARSRAPRG